MKKFKVTWYEGYMSLDVGAQKNILNTMEVEANSIDEVKVTAVLPRAEKKTFEVNIKYCLRKAWHGGELKDAKQLVSDYGSHSKFIFVEEI